MVSINLRNTVWISGGSRTGCDDERSIYTLTYSETGLATSRVSFELDADGACQPVEVIKPEQTFEALANTPEFLFTCGDGLCEVDELEQRIALAADDPRNDCTDGSGNPVAEERLLLAGGNTLSFNYMRCSNTGPNLEAFVLQ